MQKEEAIKAAIFFILSQPVNIDIGYAMGKKLEDLGAYWRFDAYYYNRNPMRPDGYFFDGIYLISKETGEINKINFADYFEMTHKHPEISSSDEPDY